MKVEGFVVKAFGKYVNARLGNEYSDAGVFLIEEYHPLSTEEKDLAVKLLGDKAEIYTIELKRIHQQNQPFSSWLEEVEVEFQAMVGTSEKRILEVVEETRLKGLHMSGIDSTETASILYNELYG